jgi:hypothetical protein
MPWRREETAPYFYEDVYTPSETERTPYGEGPRTIKEMDEAFNRAMAGKEARERRAREEAQERARKPRWIRPDQR